MDVGQCGMGWDGMPLTDTLHTEPTASPPFRVLILLFPLAGRRFHTGRCYWSHAYSREVVSWSSGLLSQFPQHHACAGRRGGLLNAQGANY